MASEGGDSDNFTKSTPTVGGDEVVASEGGDSDNNTTSSSDDEVVVASEGGDSDNNTTSSLDDEVVASERGVSEDISISAAGDDEVVASDRGVSENNSTSAAVDDEALSSERVVSENISTSAGVDAEVLASERGVPGNISPSAAGDDEVVASESGVSENISTSATADDEVVASERGVSENISTSAAVDDEVVASEGRDSENISTSAVVDNDAVASERGDENISTSAVVDNEEDVKFGFKRSEMYTGILKGSIGEAYERHVFLCYKSHESWPYRVEDSEADPLPKLLNKAIKTRQADMKFKTRLTICEGLDGGKLSDGDVLIFPDMIHYRDIKESNVDNFVEDVLVNGNPWTNGCKDVLTGSYVFICAHKKRDNRCGFCGPVLVEKFKVEIESKGLKDNVFVIPCSHVGGHKYAGNAIIYSRNTEGKIEGHWYGYVTPDDVPKLLDQHIGKGQIIEGIWRGKMSSPAKQELFSVPLYNSEENIPEIEETTSGCCQAGAGGSSCCRDGSSVEKPREEKVRENGKNHGKEKGGKPPSKWKKPGVVTTLGVIGVVAAVALIYGVCRRSK